jgi:hypothetical protein
MPLFLDPRLHGASNYRLRTAWALRKRGIEYPHLVASGPRDEPTFHFLGTQSGADRAASALDAPGLRVNRLLCVVDPNLPMPLSEPEAHLLTVPEADAMARETLPVTPLLTRDDVLQLLGSVRIFPEPPAPMALGSGNDSIKICDGMGGALMQ